MEFKNLPAGWKIRSGQKKFVAAYLEIGNFEEAYAKIMPNNINPKNRSFQAYLMLQETAPILYKIMGADLNDELRNFKKGIFNICRRCNTVKIGALSAEWKVFGKYAYCPICALKKQREVEREKRYLSSFL